MQSAVNLSRTPHSIWDALIMLVIETRNLTDEDQPLVLSLDKEFQLSNPTTTDDSEYSAEEFYRILPQLRGIALAATIDGEAVGYGQIAPRLTNGGIDQSSETRVLTHLAVLPEHQNRGVGSFLLKRLISKARRAKLSLLTAHIPQHLISFYESHGWKVCGENETVAWVEEPTVKVWEAAKASGLGSEEVGPRRKMTLLRHEGLDKDIRYPRIAYIVLRPQEIIHIFQVPESPAPARIRPHLLIAKMSKDNPSGYNSLPKEVQENAMFVIAHEVKTNPNVSPEIMRTWVPK